MKSCPKCNRTFPDEGQKFCTFDGGLLIAPQTFDPNATIRATSVDLMAPDKATSRELPDPNATIIEQFPQTVALSRDTGPTSMPNTTGIAPPPPPPPSPVQHSVPPPPPQPEVAHPGPPTAPASTPLQPQAAPSAAAPPVKKKSSKLPLIIAGVVVVLLLGGGGLAALFFFVGKPYLDERSARNNPEAPVASPTVAVETSTPVPSPTAPVDTFVPPADSVQFVNANEKLDGELAEHYLDFSFYYPKGWVKDPKSGVAGAKNFILVERALPTKETQENVAVSWYNSTGTFVGDLPNFPKRIEEKSASLAKQFDGYEKVSDGPTTVNSLDAYEFRWKASAELPTRGPVELWGRVVFVPTGNEGDKTGVTLMMFSTSLAPELVNVENLGTKGQAPLILESFRFGKKN